MAQKQIPIGAIENGKKTSKCEKFKLFSSITIGQHYLLQSMAGYCFDVFTIE